MLATILEVLDVTIGNVALPHMQASFSASVDEVTWVLTSYLVSNGIVVPMTGWLSTLFGRKRFFMGSTVLFTVSVDALRLGLEPAEYGRSSESFRVWAARP